MLQGESPGPKKAVHHHVCPHAVGGGDVSSPAPGVGDIAGRARQSPFPLISVQGSALVLVNLS
jgi:hypothetical protein